jgi:hypothetical protein
MRMVETCSTGVPHRIKTRLHHLLGNYNFMYLSDSIYLYYYYLWLCSPARAIASSSTRFLDHNDAPRSVGFLWTSDQLFAENSTCQYTTHTTDKHPATGGIRTHDRSRRAVVDLRLRLRVHWDRPSYLKQQNQI